MSCTQKAVRPLARCLRQAQSTYESTRIVRNFTVTARNGEEAGLESTSTYKPVFDPTTVTSKRGEKALMKTSLKPVGSRRLRAALQQSDNIPFEQLPYQCFQEARKVLIADREEKLKAIELERSRIARVDAMDVSEFKNGELQKRNKLDSMRRHLEWLKIQADINDPMIKKRFEDGEGTLL